MSMETDRLSRFVSARTSLPTQGFYIEVCWHPKHDRENGQDFLSRKDLRPRNGEVIEKFFQRLEKWAELNPEAVRSAAETQEAPRVVIKKEASQEARV